MKKYGVSRQRRDGIFRLIGKKTFFAAAFTGAVIMTTNLSGQEKIHVHYNRINSDYGGWSLWVWEEEGEKKGFEVKNYVLDDFGALFEIDLQAHAFKGRKIGIIPKFGDWAGKDGADRIADISGKPDIYILEEDDNIYFKKPEISTEMVKALFDEENKIRVIFTRPVTLKYLDRADFSLQMGGRIYKPLAKKAEGSLAYLIFPPLDNFRWEKAAWGAASLLSPLAGKKVVSLGGAIYGGYYYSDREMGAFNASGETFFRIFAPEAGRAFVLLCDAPGSKPEEIEMKYAGNGLWELAAGKDLAGKYYKVKVKIGEEFREGLDPYARCVTASDGMALITDTSGKVSPSPRFPLSETILYEAHVRDFTIDGNSGIERRGKYLGWTQKNTRLNGYPEIKTGLDHLKELGVNAVHLLPVQDFENDERSGDYNWGYMPVNFNSPEGWYASETATDARVKELKALINALHENGIKVIMDVVYNHTAETDSKFYNFNALAPGYYYRKNARGKYYNGSGCGNEFKTEAPMARKFIIDSLVYWTENYGVDGFRFDLMGLMDRRTAFEAVRRLTEIRPDIILYGEPWAAAYTPVDGVKKGVQKGKGFAVFNDDFRDALKGNVFSMEDLGYVQAALSPETLPEANRKRKAVIEGIRGSVDNFTDSPLESVNYVSSHDNHTLYDKIDLSLPGTGKELKAKAAFLANAVVLTSQGLPFIHSGAEFLRSKKGEENSYNLPDEINKIRWTLKRENIKIFNLYKALISLRKKHPVFRMETKKEVEENLKFYEDLNLPASPPSIAYVLRGEKLGDEWKEAVVLINPENREKKFALPKGKFRLVFDERGRVENMNLKFEREITAGPVSLTILARNR